MTVRDVGVEAEEPRRSHVREAHDRWRRLLCLMRWHTWEWAYSDDRSERWRACHYCHRERMSVGFVPVPF
jgi:hypothetical protein